MLAKGHDFPDLTLVGARRRSGVVQLSISARARSCSSILQVAGRRARLKAGRGADPDLHPTTRCSRRCSATTTAAAPCSWRSAARRSTAVRPFRLLRAESLNPARRSASSRRARSPRFCRRTGGADHGAGGLPMERRAGRHRRSKLVQCGERAPLHDFRPGWVECRRNRRKAAGCAGRSTSIRWICTETTQRQDAEARSGNRPCGVFVGAVSRRRWEGRV